MTTERSGMSLDEAVLFLDAVGMPTNALEAWAVVRAHLSRATPVAAVVGVSVTPSEYLLDLVTDVLRHHRLSLSQDDDGQGYPLIDVLTCDHKTVAEGIKECEYLADAIVGELPLADQSHAQSVAGEVEGWKEMPCYVIHPSNVDDEKKPLHKIDFGMELDGKLIFTSKYVPNGETADASAYIRDWTPDCVREYVAALKQAVQDADSALDEAEEGLMFASNARQPTKLGRDRSRERLHFVQGVREQIKPFIAAAPSRHGGEGSK